MRTARSSISEKLSQTDWSFLLFLVLFLQVKLAIKLLALLFIYLKQSSVSFRFTFRWPGIPFFYPAMILIGVVNLLFFSLYRFPNYLAVFSTGVFFWILCVLACHQVLWFVRNSTAEKVHATILVFFIINALVSFANLLVIMTDAGVINPYRYQGMYQKYFINTGDYIKGVLFDSSVANAMLSSFGVFYFLERRNFVMTILCMATLLLTFSNLGTILIVAGLAYMFLFRTHRDQKSIIVVLLAMIVLFFANVSPQNGEYSEEILRKVFQKEKATGPAAALSMPGTIDTPRSSEEKKYRIAKSYLDSMNLVLNGAAAVAAKPGIPRENIHAPESQHRPDSSYSRMQAIALLQSAGADSAGKQIVHTGRGELTGKSAGFRQLFVFLKNNPEKIATGNGIGNFSSKLAFRAAGIGSAGTYPERFRYIHHDFKNNHFLIYLNYVAKDSGQHSVINYPYSFFAQVLGEYGLAGAFCFMAGYLFYFLRHAGRFSYGIPVLMIVLAGLLTGYWFEHLSVMVVFELLFAVGIHQFRATKNKRI